MTLLVVEDDSDQLWLRCALLKQHGFRAIGSRDANSALQLASKHQPDAALVDLRIPTEADGLQLLRDLKRLHSSMRLFVLTGSDPGRFRAYPERQIVEEFIAKGSSSSSLIRRLRQREASA